MDIGKFVVKQRWRIAQTYLMITPLVGILNTFLYFLITLGVNDIQTSALEMFVGIMFVLSFFLLVGYFLDKKQLFSKDLEKGFESMNLNLFELQSNYNAINIALYMKYSKEELADMLANHEIRLMNKNRLASKQD